MWNTLNILKMFVWAPWEYVNMNGEHSENPESEGIFLWKNAYGLFEEKGHSAM